MSIKEKIIKWWWFTVKNPVLRKGERGGFKWKFRRFWLDISTLSGNFKVRFTATEHPYGYLFMGKDDDNIEGFSSALYAVGLLLTTEQKFANDIKKAYSDYCDRMEKKEVVVSEDDDRIALKDVEAIQEHAENPKRRKKKSKTA